jgi:Holliday junction DNA helicase RuvA
VIAMLRGRVARYGEDHAVLDVQGVGYLVHASAHTLRRLDGGGEVQILVETQVAADAIRLYGFADEAERASFRLLQAVQGVGAKVALSLLGTLGPDGLARAVAAGDKAALARAAGVGARLAARIAAELKDRLGEIAPPAAVAGPADAAEDDALAALAGLGFGRGEAVAALARVRPRTSGGLAEVLREALKELAAGGGVR